MKNNVPDINLIGENLSKINEKGKKATAIRFVGAVSSSLPWIGNLIGAMTALHAEKEQGKINQLQKIWLEEHESKLTKLKETINAIFSKLENFNQLDSERVQSEQYLTLVKKGFREWDNSETYEKKTYIKNLLTNAAIKDDITTDDLIRLFIDWISTYHETHFYIIKEIYNNKVITRKAIWSNINDAIPREDSLEADLYKLLIRDLSTGGLIRQHRETDNQGNFIPKSRKKKGNNFTSAFDDSEGYELTELGKQFVQYAMEDISTEIES